MSDEILTLILTSGVQEDAASAEKQKRLEISSRSPFRLIRTSGLEHAAATLDFSEHASVDGAFYQGCRVAQRAISFEFEAEPSETDAELRASLVSFFVPGEQGTLTVARGSTIRAIRYHMEGAVFEQETVYAPLHVKVRVFCCDPWFEELGETVLSIPQVTPTLNFPFDTRTGTGINAGYKPSRVSLQINNDGDLPVGFRAKLRAYMAFVRNPSLSCNGMRLTINKVLVLGDVLEISTCSGDKYVRVNGVDISFDRQSAFFSLPVGQSTLEFSSSTATTRLCGEISFRKKYVGV